MSYDYAKIPNCHDCGVAIGEVHAHGCDVELCPRCGGQRIGCGCIYEVNGMDSFSLEDEHPEIYTEGPTDEMYAKWDAEWDHRRLPWTGIWPGVEECVEFGWYAKLSEEKGWVRCGADDPEGCPDLNRLPMSATWDATKGRWTA